MGEGGISPVSREAESVPARAFQGLFLQRLMVHSTSNVRVFPLSPAVPAAHKLPPPALHRSRRTLLPQLRSPGEGRGLSLAQFSVPRLALRLPRSRSTLLPYTHACLLPLPLPPPPPPRGRGVLSNQSPSADSPGAGREAGAGRASGSSVRLRREPTVGGRCGSRRMESWQSLDVEVDSSHSLLASVARLNTRREESDLSEFPSVEEGVLTVSEEDGKDRAGEASCSPLLAIEDTSGSPCIPLLASSPTHKVWDETLFQQSELEFVPLRGIPDLSEVSESRSRHSQVNEALFPSSSEGPSDFCDNHPSLSTHKTVEISTIASYETGVACPRFPRQQAYIYTNKKSTSSPDTGDELSRSYGKDGVETLDSHMSLRTWETTQKLETFPSRQDQSVLKDDGVSPLDCRLSHSSLLPCLEKNRLGFSSPSDRSICESFKLDFLKSDESKVARLGDICSLHFKGEISSKFMSHSLFPTSSQCQSVQNSVGPNANSVKLSVHSDSTRAGSSGIAFHSGFQHSDRFKLDDMSKPGPDKGFDANKTMAFHEVVASIEPTASKNSSAAVQDLLGVRSDQKQTISPLSSQTEKSSPGQPTQPSPSVFPVQNFTPVPSLRSAPATSKLQFSFVSSNEELANPNPRNLAVWKPQSPSGNQDVSSESTEKPLPCLDTMGTSGDLPYVSPLTQTYSPTLVNIMRYDISRSFPIPGEASQPLASFKDTTLGTNAVMKDDTNIKSSQLYGSGIISSGRVAEMLRDEKYNMKDLPETREPSQNDIEPSGGSTFPSGLTDQVRDGASERSIPPLTFSQAKSHKSTSTTDSKPVPAELLLADAEVKVYQDRTSQTSPERKVHHRFIDSRSFVPPIPCVPLPVIEPPVQCPNTLGIFYKSSKITSNVHSNFNSGISHVSGPIPVESHSHRDSPVPTGTLQHLDFQDKSQIASASQQQVEQASESSPETFPKFEQAEEKSVSPAIPSATSCNKEDFKIISERVQRLIDHWDSHLHEDHSNAVPLPMPTPASVDKGGKKSKPALSDIKGIPMSVDKDGKKGKPTLSDIKEMSEGKPKIDKGLHTLLVEAENIARKRVSSSQPLYPDVVSPQLSRLDDSREAPLSKASMGLSHRLRWDENVTLVTKVETNAANRLTSQRDTGKISVQEMERKARAALKETLRQYETVQSVSRCEHGQSSAFIGDEISVPVRPFTSSNSSSDSSDVRVSYMWDPGSDSFFGYPPNIPAHVHVGDILEREIVCDSDDGCSSDDSLAAHVRHLLTCDTPGSLATQMLRNAEEEECRVRARAWNLKFNLATEYGNFMTELDEADMRKVEEIKADLLGCGRPLDLFQVCRRTQAGGTSDHFRNADSAASLKLSSDAITQITTEGSQKTTFSSEIIINSQPHNVLNKPSHCPTAQLSLLPYKPSGSAEMYYVPNSAEPPQYPVAKSETTLESTHSGSNDAIAPDFPPDALGTRDENMSDIVTIKHKEGIYSKKTMCKSAWPEERNPPQENISESKNQLELENTTHSVFKSAQFYFHHPVHHHHHHDFFSCEPWGRGTCLAHSRRDPCFSLPYETCEDDHRFSPLQTEMDYTRIERYCWNVGGNREPGAGQRLGESLKVDSKKSGTKETSRIRFSLAQTLEPRTTLSELWDRFQERQKKQKPPASGSSDELSLVDRLDRLAKVLQKPMMLSLQASESAPDDFRGESTQQQRRRKSQPKKKDENESPTPRRSRWPPQSPFGLVGGDQAKHTSPRQPGLDSVSTISSDSRPSPEPADPVFESDAAAQADGEAGPPGEVSSDMSSIDPARIVQGRTHESPKRQQKHLSERQREGSRKVAKWKQVPPTSPQVGRKGAQVDSVVSSDSVSTVSSAWSPTPTPRKKQTVRMLNKGVQTGELEIVRSTRKHTRDFGVTFPTPKYSVTGKRVDDDVNTSSPGSHLGEKEPLTFYLWTKKPRRSKPHCSEGVSWFIPAENLRCASKKENQSSRVSGPGPSWFAALTHTKPWRQPLQEQNWQTDSRGSGRPPGLSDDKEAQRRFVKAGLQESLERLRPDFISRSGARVKRLRLITEERKLQHLLQRERDELFNTAEQQRESQDIAGFLSKKGYGTLRNRPITKKEMVQRSKRIYEQLPEVRKKREEEQRKSAYTTYRYKAQLYKMKITNRVLGRKVPWD
ncbi:Alstrom syndrome protein 1 [Trichosurus vulpecula]|uniref:Alstrom syndrome protein 1 n=1 Tax=Trichosurus vulpecula TaxID=9337 RepID=UPI00186B20FB|nr:Alstrom syndrome protein 1 [Trichosurus vulpecula]